VAASTETPGFVTRVGLALVAPRWALAIGDDPRAPGRAGSDLIRLLALVLVCVHTRTLIAAVWIGTLVAPGFGLRAAVGSLSQAFTAPLAFLIAAAGLIWVLGGRQRTLGRAFDLACVALVPVMAVDIVGTLVMQVRFFSGAGSMTVGLQTLLFGAGFAWSGALIALAVVQIRRPRRARVAAEGPP